MFSRERAVGQSGRPLVGKESKPRNFTMKLKDIPVDEMLPDPHQPRRQFDPATIENLAASLKHAQLVPLIVCAVPNGFQIVDGEQRWRGAKLAGLAQLSAVVLDAAPTPVELLKIQLQVNCLRKQLRPLERAAAYQKLLGELHCTQAELASMLLVSDATVTTCLSLLKLPPEIQRRVDAGELPLSSAYGIARAKDRETQLVLADQAAGGNLKRDALQRRVRKPQPGGVTVKRIQCVFGEHTVTLASAKRMDFDAVVSVLESVLREARRALSQPLDELTWVRVLRDRAQASAARAAAIR
jgi:ParB family chromosome partitioning protein